MKILCLILIFANVSLFLWEYRGGAFDKSVPTKSNQNQMVERIKLANESSP